MRYNKSNLPQVIVLVRICYNIIANLCETDPFLMVYNSKAFSQAINNSPPILTLFVWNGCTKWYKSKCFYNLNIFNAEKQVSTYDILNCLKAMSKTFHPECFVCAYCGKIFANSPFYLEDGLPYCEEDWNELFTTKCVSCGFPIEAGDRWVEALNNNYHSQCFNCMLCKKNLEGQGFFVKAGKPFCKSHAKTRFWI